MIKASVQYIKSSYQELKKVTWPTRAELIRYFITIVISLVLAVGVIMAVDYGLSRLVKLIFSL